MVVYGRKYNTALEAFREDRSMRNTTGLFRLPRTSLRRRIIVEDNTTKSESCQTLFVPRIENCSTMWSSDGSTPTGFRPKRRSQSLHVIRFGTSGWNSITIERTRSSGKNELPTFLWYDTDRIESGASKKSSLPRERLYWVVTWPR
jgi:hypothetical protein